MNKTLKRHRDAIRGGIVTRSNIIGLRKAINAAECERRGYSTSRTSIKATVAEIDELEDEIGANSPRADAELHASGLKVLRSPRYAKRLAPVAGIVADLSHFRLIGFDRIGAGAMHCTPVWRAVAKDGRGFDFRNVSWQSGGDGPEVLSY